MRAHSLPTTMFLVLLLGVAGCPTTDDDDTAAADDDDSTGVDDDDSTVDDDDVAPDDDDIAPDDDDVAPDDDDIAPDDDDDGDDDDSGLPTDQQAPPDWSGGGGEVALQIEGPGPWPGAPSASLSWSNAGGPDDSPGMICRWGDGYWGSGSYIVSSSWGYAFKGAGEGRYFWVVLAGWGGGGTFTAGGAAGGAPGGVHCHWDCDDSDPSTEVTVELSTAAGGACAVTVDPLWWTGSVSCTGLEASVEDGADAGPVDLTATWSCQGTSY